MILDVIAPTREKGGKQRLRAQGKLKFSSSEIRRDKETDTGLFWNGLKGSSHLVFSSFCQESRR